MRHWSLSVEGQRSELFTPCEKGGQEGPSRTGLYLSVSWQERDDAFKLA